MLKCTTFYIGIEDVHKVLKRPIFNVICVETNDKRQQRFNLGRSVDKMWVKVKLSSYTSQLNDKQIFSEAFLNTITRMYFVIESKQKNETIRLEINPTCRATNLYLNGNTCIVCIEKNKELLT